MQIKRMGESFSICKVEDYSDTDLTSEFVFVGKTDEENSDYNAAFNTLRERFGNLVTVDRPAKNGDFVELDLAGLVDSAADEVWPQAHARGIRIDVDTRDAETEEAIVRGDFSLLRRAVINLLTNAIKYGAANSTVSASLSAEGQDWVIRVRDQGEGIPPDALPRLFKRFSRIVDEGRDKPTGVGLGLLIVKTVAERHGGTVEVDSRPGEGCTFALRLPLRALG